MPLFLGLLGHLPSNLSFLVQVVSSLCALHSLSVTREHEGHHPGLPRGQGKIRCRPRKKKKKLWFFVLDLKSNSLKHSLALSFRTGLERWRLMHWIEET